MDGEDLASLLRRIGRLPADKATELARQLCAGLASAHDRGVLHRDLKPANVLIDGRGRVRIADFGLAGLSEDQLDRHEVAGTPGYMAPEQYVGQGTATRTDVYALGLVLYEMFTGKPAFSAIEAERFARATDSSPATTPSTLIPDIDPAVERVIVRCLEKNPARRPSSAIAVAAALPGGDPLAAALAAGETPSPEMVAAAGDEGSISPVVGVSCLIAIALGLAAIVWMSHKTTLLSYVIMEKSPDALADRARTIVRDLGYADPPVDFAYGFVADNDYLNYVRDHDQSPTRWETLRAGRPSPLLFWYRESPRHLDAPRTFEAQGRVSPTDPPMTVPGMVSVLLDPAGRLTGLLVVPRPTGERASQATGPDWARVFSEAGLQFDRFASVEPGQTTPFQADVQGAWEGAYTERPDVKIRVVSAAAAGRTTYFEVLGPTARPRLTTLSQAVSAGPLGGVINLIVFVTSILLARHNLRVGRADRRGAARLAAFMGVTALATRLLMVHGVVDLSQRNSILTFASTVLPFASWLALLLWITYLAIEPHVRRLWPEAWIGWSRLLAGRFRDPLVGRDAIIGVITGVALACLAHLAWLVPPRFGSASLSPIAELPHAALWNRLWSWTLLLGGRMVVAQLIDALHLGVLSWNYRAPVPRGADGLFAAPLDRSCPLFFVVMPALVALPTVGGLSLGFQTPGHCAGHRGIVGAVAVALSTFVLLRFGALAMMVASFCAMFLSIVPFTVDSSAPYFTASLLILGSIVAITAYGLHTALAGRPLFGPGFLKEEPAK